ncbi:MAG: cob(I)yrinic acid a,c-diamide adenosyltransferase [Nitrosopumilaceae archaeon]|nr:cob(I)yrinic acid a,c-diamide adenosyltransferase [Nitrosopumilaceae archaeon]
MKIYTKTGDDGTTGLQGDLRVSKANSRIIAYGSIDEVNAQLGIVLSCKVDKDLEEILIKIQNDLFVVGADLSNPNLEKNYNRVTSEMIDFLENKIDQFESELSPLTNFILPGGEIASAQIHYARTIVRRAEINVTVLSEKEKINPYCLSYLNRLSDLLFVLGRVINKRLGKSDTIWKVEKDKL